MKRTLTLSLSLNLIFLTHEKIGRGLNKKIYNESDSNLTLCGPNVTKANDLNKLNY